MVNVLQAASVLAALRFIIGLTNNVPSCFFFCFSIRLGEYIDLADPMPDTDLPVDADFHEEERELLTINDHPLLQINVCISKDGGTFAPKRFLNPGKFEDLWQLHQHSPESVSKETLRNCWGERWKKMMPFRNFGQGKRCTFSSCLDY